MDTLEKYSWLIDKLRTFKELTLTQIEAEWQKDKNAGGCFGRSKFNLWRKDIEDRLGISIKWRKAGRDYLYYIDNNEKINDKSINSWVINSVSVGNTLSSYRSLEDRIICDAVPKGTEYLPVILGAMSANISMAVTMKNYSGTQFEVIAEPYALRQHGNRWYVLCRVGKFDSLQLYELENILKVELLKNKKFRLPSRFNADEYFSRFFGVMIMENIKPRLLTIRVWGKDAEQLRALPIHPSQEELPGEGDEYADFRYYVAPTPDFMNYLLGLGSNVEVLEPEQCRFEMETKVKTLGNRYFGWPFDSDPSKVTLNGNFAAFDIKLANNESSSIYSIAVVIVRDYEIVHKFHSYVRPEPFVFDEDDVETVSEETLLNAPSLQEVWSQIKGDIGALPLVSYFGLDEVLLKEAFAHYNMDDIESEHRFVDISSAVEPILGQEVPWMTCASMAALSGMEITDEPSETHSAEFVAYLALRYL